MIWVYYLGAIEQVLEEFNNLDLLADKYPDAIYFYAELVMD